MTEFPANIKPAELHFIIGLSKGACAITAGNAYALITIIEVKKAHNSMHLPLYGSDM